jgi:calcium binding protein 39
MFEDSERTDAEKSELLASLLDSDLPVRMLAVLPELDFEARKDVMRLFNHILQLGSVPVFEYVRNHGQMLELLLAGCGNAEVALQSNMMLRSCTRHAELVVCLLEANFATGLLKLTQHQTFDISSDAFSSLRELLLTHKAAAAAHLEGNFREFFLPYNELLQAEDYVTQRQALRLLGEILLDRRFMRVMLSYVSDEQFLQIHMNLLRTSSKAIQADAFHVFKIFAANPNKPPKVHQILMKNRERLVKLLDSMGKEGDESFAQDRKAVVQALQALEPLPTRTTSGYVGGSEKEGSDDPIAASGSEQATLDSSEQPAKPVPSDSAPS